MSKPIERKLKLNFLFCALEEPSKYRSPTPLKSRND
jgi:hypothetical protein